MNSRASRRRRSSPASRSVLRSVKWTVLAPGNTIFPWAPRTPSARTTASVTKSRYLISSTRRLLADHSTSAIVERLRRQSWSLERRSFRRRPRLGETSRPEPVEVYGVASFYPMFHLRPIGRHVISVCRNISCDLRGAEEIVQRACVVTSARVGESSDDGRFYLETVECQGACADAPMMVVDGTYHENLESDDVDRIIGGLE